MVRKRERERKREKVNQFATRNEREREREREEGESVVGCVLAVICCELCVCIGDNCCVSRKNCGVVVIVISSVEEKLSKNNYRYFFCFLVLLSFRYCVRQEFFFFVCVWFAVLHRESWLNS